jgi:hypothetical protein
VRNVSFSMTTEAVRWTLVNRIEFESVEAEV